LTTETTTKVETRQSQMTSKSVRPTVSH